MEHREIQLAATDSWQRALSLWVISYLLFGRSVSMRCFKDLNDFNDLNPPPRLSGSPWRAGDLKDLHAVGFK
jgi:hypothetical protein